MAAPANDAYTGHISLFSQLVNPEGSLEANNFEATPDAGLGETSDIKSVWYTCYLISRSRVFIGTRRFAADGAGGTDMDTVLTLYAPGGSPSSVVASSDDYAGWERESLIRLPFGINFTGFYWLRVHGKDGAEGNFKLRWGFAAQRVLTRKCHVRKTDGLIYMAGLRLPAVDASSSTSFGTFDEGRYLVRYADGAFRFGDTTVPNPGNLTDFAGTRIPAYQWIQVGHQFFGSAQTPLTGPQLPYASQLACENAHHFRLPAVAGPTYRASCYFHHDGGGDITLNFVDDQYTDNLEGDPLPGFILYRVVPWVEKVLPAEFGTVASTGDSGVLFQFRNPGSAAANGRVALLEYGGIESPSPADVALSVAAGGTASLAAFAYSLTNEGATALTARLQVSDDYGYVVRTFDIDLTPKLEVRAAVVCENTGGNNWTIKFPIFNAGFGPTRLLVATVVNSLGVESLYLSQTGEVEIGVIQPRTTYELEATLVAPEGQPFKVTIGLVDARGLDGEHQHANIVFTGRVEEV